MSGSTANGRATAAPDIVAQDIVDADAAVAVSALCRNYGSVEAIKDVSFTALRGEIFGIIGADGAGKTTLFRLLATLLLPDSGKAKICGLDTVQDYRAIRRMIGYMPGRFSLYQDLTVEENLDFFASVFNTSAEKNRGLVEDIYAQIEPFADRRAGALSGGMKQKLALCCALIHRPAVLFLDEPTTGVDPVSRREFWDMLGRLKKEGLGILVSTPYMDEASLCDRVALLKEGRFLAVDSPERISSSFEGLLLSVRGPSMYRLLLELRSVPGVISAYAFGDSHHVRIGGLTTAQPADEEVRIVIRDLRESLARGGYGETEIAAIEPGMEDCFMGLTDGGIQRWT